MLQLRLITVRITFTSTHWFDVYSFNWWFLADIIFVLPGLKRRMIQHTPQVVPQGLATNSCHSLESTK